MAAKTRDEQSKRKTELDETMCRPEISGSWVQYWPRGSWRGQTGENEDGNKGPSGRNTQGRSPSKEAKRDKVQWDDTGWELGEKQCLELMNKTYTTRPMTFHWLLVNMGKTTSKESEKSTMRAILRYKVSRNSIAKRTQNLHPDAAIGDEHGSSPFFGSGT